MSKTLVIGASGLVGSHIVEALGEENCIRASRNFGERVDISDQKSLAALFARIGELDGIVCAGGAARFKPWDQLSDDDWTFPDEQADGTGQCRAVRGEECSARRGDHADDGRAGAVSRPRRRSRHDRQRRGGGFRARRDNGAHARTGQCGLARVGVGNARRDGRRSGNGYSRGRSGLCQALRDGPSGSVAPAVRG